MFSAYDLKKIIPRAIFALVLVNLSWGLMEIFIRAVDVIGKGAEELVMAPFGDIGRGIEIGASSGAAVFTLTAVGAAGAAFGLIPILGVAITGLFGILFAFVITLIRRVLLIGLVIIAPVAIALSVFPQTESWAKKWWDWFSKLLLMYPFIMAFFGLSKVSAGIISKARGTDVATDIMYDLAAIALLILPYFFVGKALSLAGGAIGKVAGMVNNKDKGFIDRTKKWDQKRVSTNRADAKAGTRYQDRFGTRTINRGMGLVAN
ncbi:MAG: hypothetical protein QG623_693, partial [Patescibacteria group bacterium]|nr:hypothetical protein [Patescibacteria group bacterium]